MKKVAVFAGNECVEERESYYFSLAHKTGQLLAKNGFVTITGGGQGLMNQVMKGAFENGGESIAVCLEMPGRKNTTFTTEKFSFHSLHPRQNKILSLAEGFIALPGGIGTFYEIAEVLALKRKKEISRLQPVVLIDSYFKDFSVMVDSMAKEGFVRPDFYNLYDLVATPQEAIKILQGSTFENEV